MYPCACGLRQIAFHTKRRRAFIPNSPAPRRTHDARPEHERAYSTTCSATHASGSG
jgi:hypothetical protein